MVSRRGVVCGFLLGACLSWSPSQGAAVRAHPESPGASKGGSPGADVPMFLVARRSMGDPRFAQTVLLLVKHGTEGTLGLVINRPTQLLLSQVAPDLKGVGGTKHVVFLGGPVNPEVILYLVRSRSAPEDGEKVLDDVYFGVTREPLEGLLSGGTPASALRVYAGYAGWGPGQLEAEMARGDWLLVPADASRVFAKDPDHLWRDLIEEREPAGNLVHNDPDRLLAIPVGGADPRARLVMTVRPRTRNIENS